MTIAITKGYTFGATELVTNTKLHDLVEDSVLTGDLSYPYEVTAQTTATLALTAAHSVIVCDTTANAIAITLPEANDNIGKKYLIFLQTDGGTNVTIARTGSDVLNAANNTLATLADAEDFIELIAVSANRWLVIKDNGIAYSTP
jgi:hypothetical protein